MKLYHRTPYGDTIVADGFRDGEDTYGYLEPSSGVWLSDTTLTVHEGAKGDDVLVIDMPEEIVVPYERTTVGLLYREFQVPAAVLNRHRIQRLWRCDECCGDDVDPDECPPGKALIQIEKPDGWLWQRGHTPFGEQITITLCDDCSQLHGFPELFTPDD